MKNWHLQLIVKSQTSWFPDLQLQWFLVLSFTFCYLLFPAVTFPTFLNIWPLYTRHANLILPPWTLCLFLDWSLTSVSSLCPLWPLRMALRQYISALSCGCGGWGVKVRVKTRLKGRQSSSTPLFVHCCSFLPLLTLAHSPLTCSSHLFTAISQHSLRWHSKEDSARACSVENPTSLKGYFFPKPTEASLRGFLMSVENVRVVPGSN